MPRRPSTPTTPMRSAITPKARISLLAVLRSRIQRMAVLPRLALPAGELPDLRLRELEDLPALQILLLPLVDPGLPVLDRLGHQPGPVGRAEGNELHAPLLEDRDGGGVLLGVERLVSVHRRPAQAQDQLLDSSRERLPGFRADTEEAERGAERNLVRDVPRGFVDLERGEGPGVGQGDHVD